MRDRVEAILHKIRLDLIRDGNRGMVELVDVNDGTVKVKLTGALVTCRSSVITVKKRVERTIKQEIPEIKEVVSV